MKSNRILFLLLGLLVVGTASVSAQQHPYLYFTDEKVSLLKEQLKSDSQIKAAYAEIEQVARQALKESNPHGRLEYVALAYLVSGDKKYADKIKGVIRTMGAKESLEARDMLNRKPAWTSTLPTAHVNFQLAIGFDAVYNDLSPDERIELAQAIYNAGMRTTWNDWLSPETRFHAINSMGHNYWASCTAMMGVAAIAVAHEIPEAARCIDRVAEALTGWVTFPGDVLQNKPRNFDNGAYYESVSYANYGTSQYLYFRLALQNYDSTRTWPEKEQLAHAADYYLYMCYPSTGDYLPSFYFGDSSMSANGEAVLKLLWALDIRKPDMLWYLAQVRKGQQKECMPINTPMGILYTPGFADATPPSLPLSTSYDEMGWASMRKSWEENSTLLGIKCGHTWNHAHADAGSFILFHNGEQVIKDAGNCWYPNPLYREYFFQSQAHNVLLFDGKAQPEEQQYKGSLLDGSLHHLVDGGNIKYILADVTGPTARYFAKNHRSFLWIDDVILVIDDVRTYDYGTFSLLFHPDGESKKQGIDICIANKQSAVNIRPIWPEYLTESDFEHDFPDNLKLKMHQGAIAKKTDEVETYCSVIDPAKQQRAKFITAIILKDSPDTKDCPQVSRISGDELLGVRIAHRGKVTEVYLNERADGHIMHRNSNHVINGWDTDAYLLAYSYKEDTDSTKTENIMEWFVGYGSYLRKPGNIVFDSFAKQFVVLNGSLNRED
ncbi:heparinase II/III family protein [Bacteroides sp. 51]|uniref:heparinase II/III domain-containing protein n=1 Tax=Bacteroides sp. 51 TaxID=2302938 RepID=UPI0013D20D74|nr:heparinase II/III family protein [Bacteroides sp. 51]NDV83661.1 heparinase [Bacteroides sp. 51]